MKYLDPLSDFVHRNRLAPYHTDDMTEANGKTVRRPARVVPVNCKTGLARARKWARLVHQVESMAGVFEDGRMRIAARWVCGKTGSPDVIVVSSAESGAMCPACEDRGSQPAVYRFFDADGGLLYVGCTTQVNTRLRAHRGRIWSYLVDRVEVERYPTLDEAFAAEQKAIATENPEFNRAAPSSASVGDGKNGWRGAAA
jgi:predicted GIY-YIG superfamily endonuclease